MTEVLVALALLALVFFGISLALWWLLPLAFPALSLGFGNAMALTGAIMAINVPSALVKLAD